MGLTSETPGPETAARVLEVAGVEKHFVDERFRKCAALGPVDLTVDDGEFIALLGPSGCGKSTLLRLVAGLDFPTNGEVRYLGRPVAGPSVERGLVFQAYNSFPWLSVRENVAFGFDQAERRGNAPEIQKWLEFVGLEEFADAYPKVLSGGMRQRMALARSMIVQPKLLLLDEPFGALDERTRDSMQRLLVRVADETDCAVIIVTHDVREALLLCDRVYLLTPRPGTIAEIFSPATPRPRPREYLKSREFDDLHRRVLDRFSE